METQHEITVVWAIRKVSRWTSLNDSKSASFTILVTWNHWSCDKAAQESLLKTIVGSNHDDDGNKNPTNLHIWQWKTVFLHALHVHFSSFDILKTFSFFLWPVLQLCGRREHMMTNVQWVCLVMSLALVPI